MNTPSRFEVVTLTLNPAIDQTISVPNFTAGQVNRVAHSHTTAGGKGINVAAALADWGIAVAATGFLGCKNRGPFDALFSDKHITDAFLEVPGETRVGIKIIDPAQGQTTDINFPGLAPAPADLDAVRERLGMLEAPWFVLAGSVPPGVHHSIYRQLTEILRKRGRKVVVDTSGVPLALAIEAAPSVIKPNVHELEGLLGKSLSTEAEIISAAETLVSQGIEMVVVSMGKAGACFVTAKDRLIARPPEVAVASTVGAGDAMVAGIVAGQLQALPLAQCARLATAFSADAILHIEPGLSSAAAVESLMERVVVREV